MSTISASTTSTTAYKVTADTTGTLVFQTGSVPTTALTIGSDQSVTFAGTPTYSGGTANGVLYLNGSKAITSGSALVFDGTNLGVGVTPVGLDSRFKNLEVGPTASLSSILVSSTSLLTYLQHNSYVDSSGATKFKYTGGSNYASQYNQNNGSHLWQTSTAAGTGGNACTFTTNMTLDASGNLGIGATSPSARLHVQDSSGGTVGTVWLGSATYYGTIQHDGAVTGANIYTVATASGGGHIFKRGSTEQMRIDSSGRLLVGAASFPNYGTLNSYTNSSAPAARFVGGPSTSDGTIALMVDKYSGTNTTSQWFLGFTISNQTTASGVITANGASQAAFGSWSDRRLKENIVDLPPQLDNIMALRPVEFDYIESEGGGHQISFIAQEFEEVYPDAIGERSDGMKTLTGWSKTEARLVKAIQELKAELDTAKAQIAALQGAA